MSRQPCTTAWYSTPRALWKRLAISSSVIGSIRSTRSSVASPRNDWISCTSHWNNSVVSGVSGRIQPALRSRTAPIRWSLRQTPTRCRVGVRGRLVSSVSQRIELTVMIVTPPVKGYTPDIRGGPAMEAEKTTERVPIRELVRYYLRLGVLGFGGPVALVGQMERELVRDKKWLTKEEMREGIAVCQSLPGPLAIQVGIWISYIRGGFWGAWAGGWAFILPNFVIVAALGALYVHFGGLPWVTAIFYGVSPAVIALILHSCYRLTKLGMKDWLEWGLAAAAFAITVAVQAEVALVFIGCGIVGVIYYGFIVRARASVATTRSVLLGVPFVAAVAAPATVGEILGKLLAFFLKAGSLTFGSGLVIVPFLEKGLVQQTGWLTEREFLVAVAMGMISPGPVVITATFVGYLVAGFWGAVVATIGIFLPSFLLILIVAPILVRYRTNQNVRGFIRGAYAAAIGTILGACVLLARIAIGDWLTALVALGSLVMLFRWKVSNPVLVAVTAIIGLIVFPLLNPAWVFVK